MGRELKRVPLDFDWPLKKVWGGFLMPDSLSLPTCPACNGDGYSQEAYAIANTFYPHMLESYSREHAQRLAWSDKIGQKEVDYLVAEGRLRVWRDGEWHSEPRTAAEINAENKRPGMNGHDGINRWLLVRFRCQALGIDENCPTCDGKGDIGTDRQRRAYDEWQGTPPPEGEGYQLWETVSEGSPISPVFPDEESFVRYLTSEGYSEHAARSFVKTGWVMSMVTQGNVMASNLDAFDLLSPPT